MEKRTGMKQFQVTVFPLDSDTPNAQVLVWADSMGSAHDKAFAIIKTQYPGVRPEACNTLMVTEVYSFNPPSSD
mgnify:CR=1 FL=1|jgi:hypothetical protein